PFRSARASCEQLAGVPVDRIAEPFLVRREVAFKHATPRTEGFNAGLDIRAHRIRHHLRRWRLGLLLKSETVDGLAKSADLDIDIFMCSQRLDRRSPEGKLLLQLAGVCARSNQPADVIKHDFRVRECARKVRDLVKLGVKDQGIERESKS